MKPLKNKQLVLNLFVDDHARFSNFLFSEKNEELAKLLPDFIIQEGKTDNFTSFIFLSGEKSTGKSHLLQAATLEALNQGKSAIYLPLKLWQSLTLSALKNLTEISLICLDDLQEICGDKLWETAIMQIFDNAQINNQKLIISANQKIDKLSFCLNDLRSRLASGLNYFVFRLSDEEKAQALELRAKNRGIELSEQVLKHLLTNYSRNLKELFHILDVLDRESLIQKKKITVNFINEIFPKN